MIFPIGYCLNRFNGNAASVFDQFAFKSETFFGEKMMMKNSANR